MNEINDMKKYIAKVCLLVVMAVGGRVQCQYSDLYYHRVGDTVEWKANNGYYSWWELQSFFEDRLALMPSNYYMAYVQDSVENATHQFACGYWDSTIILQKFYTPMPLKIIGIAGCIERINLYTGERDTDGIQEYLYIYDADSDAFMMKAQVPWSTFDTCRYLHFWWNSMHAITWGAVPDSCCQYYPQEACLRLQEYYFDTAIWVIDSFYVGGSLFGNCANPAGRSLDFDFWNDSLATGYYSAYSRYPGNHYLCDSERQTQGLWEYYNCGASGITVRFKDESDDGQYGTPLQYSVPFANEEWYWIDNPGFSLLVYPIVEVDTTVPPAEACPPVSNVQVTASGTSATVTWDDFPNYSNVLLRYGMCNLSQSQWTEIDVTGSTLHTLTGLSESARYGVRMKAVCDTSKKVTPWTDVVEFYTGQDTSGGTEGIDGEVTALSSLTFVQPNPARNEVRVTSSFNLRRLELHDLSGVMVYSEPVSGHEKVLDVSWLRAGTYIMTIATHDGTTHKRLQIVR